MTGLETQVVGEDIYGNEHQIALCSQGVVLEGDKLKDVATGEMILWQHHSTWEFYMPDGGVHVFKRVFCQPVIDKPQGVFACAR
jgi:hypothetical protein